MHKFPVRKSNRLKGYNYSDVGYYYVTICTKDKKHIFGNLNVGAALVSARNIKLSKLGQIVEDQWNNIPNQYKNIELDKYVIMPNHIHGILVINKRDETSAVPTISQIIRSFKSKSTMVYLKYIKQNNLNVSMKIWQRSFYDHVIRNEESLDEIREYILNNPLEWDIDKRDETSAVPTISYIGLGSNLGDREKYIKDAVSFLDEEENISVKKMSSIYETEPVGGPPQDKYLNSVISIETNLSPRKLLNTTQKIENALGRTRTVKWGARTIDIDILTYGDERIDEEDLKIPHPLMEKREFVLKPLKELLG